jgi:DNA-binding MarR family transcriptional regulator
MPNAEHELRILEALEQEPDATQAGLAAQLGVAVGTVNWYLKRLIKKGYVKTKQLERRNLKYFVTPSGLALKARLTKEYMEVSLRVYRELRRAAKEILAQVTEAGYDSVAMDGGGESGSEGGGSEGSGSEGAVEIFRLTCLEQGVSVDGSGRDLPRIRAAGRAFAVTWPDEVSRSE